MNNNPFLYINGSLTLEKSNPAFSPLKLLFEVILQSDQLLISNIKESTDDRNVVLTGTTSAWGNEPANLTLIYTPLENENAQLQKITFKKHLAEFDAFSFPGVVLNNLRSFLIVSVDSQSSSLAYISHEITGDIQLGADTIIPFKIQNYASDRAYFIKSNFQQGAGPGLTDLAILFGNHDNPERDLAWLPESLRDTKIISLRDVVFKIDPNEDVKLTAISTTVDVAPDHLWHIIPGVSFFAIGNIWFALEVEYPLESDYRFPIFTIGGTIQIGDSGTPDGRIDLTARWPDWAIKGQLERGSQIKLGRLLQELSLPIDQLPKENNALIIDQLYFDAEPTTDPKEFSFFISIRNVWTLQLSRNSTLEIEELSLDLAYQGQPPDSTENGVTGQFAGKFSVSGVELSLLAAYGGANTGWDFAGETGKGQKIPIGRFITDDLAPKFGGFIPPNPIAGLEIENLSTSFNTSSKDFAFSGEMVLPPAEGSSEQVDFRLNIELKNQSNGSYSKRFDGLLKIKGLTFEVLFDSQRQVSAVGDPAPASDSQTFLAVFQNQSGRPVAIDDLLSPLGITAQTGLSFIVKEALLGYQKTASGDPGSGVPSTTNGKWLFGIDIEGGLNLSAIHIDDLPFVSIPPDQTLKLNFQLLAASTAFTKEEIDALSSLAPSGSLTFPAKEINQVDLSVTLDFGAGSKAVDLPIGLQTMPNPMRRRRGRRSKAVDLPIGLQTRTGGNGLAPQENNIVSSPQSGSGVAVVGQDGVRWITLQKQLGPLAFERVGVKYANGEVSALLDASFSAGGLTIALNGLRMTSPISQFKPTFGLDGLGIDFKNASVEIGGTFLKEDNGFAGLAVIKTKALSLSAIGAYAYADGAPSLFIYAVLDYPIGGPAFFYVTGVAAGFGYNRRLVMPSIEQVAAFPLVQEATGAASATPLPTDQTSRAARLQQEIRSLSSAIPIDHGQYFLAVGIKFTSFKQIDSFALLAVQFGNRFEIDLLGLSTLKVPAPIGGEAVTPVAEAQLALRAVFIPSEGFLGVQAQLTSSSYILSRACRLTGGFAFYSWFSGEHEGDFVLTLGGYHPAFVVPAHYPTVPRLGFMWQVSNNFYLSGGLYFALTAHALMAGGRLEAVYQSGNQDSRFAIKAWFTANVDFLIAWKPYHYEIEVFVSLGLEIIVRYFGTHTVSLSAGANLKLWGPEFGGEAHVQVKVLIFKIFVDISFGSRAGAVPAIGFDEFKQTYLPAKPEETCSVTIKSGLIDTVTENGRVIWLVNAKEMVLVTNSMIPSGKAAVFGQERDWDGSKPAIQPMGVQIDELSTTHSVIFEGVSETDLEALVVKPITKKQPAALWGKPQLAASDPIRHVGGQRYVEKPQLNGERFVEDTLAGYEIRVGQSPIAGASKPVSTSVLRSEIEPAGSVSEWRQFSMADPLGASAWQAAATSENLVRNQARDDILAALGMTQLEIDFGEFVTDHVKV